MGNIYLRNAKLKYESINNFWVFFTSFFANAGGMTAIARFVFALETFLQKKEEIENLIGRDSDWCVWADTIKRKRPETRPWHYINLARDDFTYPQRIALSKVVL